MRHTLIAAATAQAHVVQVVSAASTVVQGVAVQAVQPSVLTLGQALQTLLGDLEGFVLPPEVAAALSAAQQLVPLIQAAVGVAMILGSNP